jgi:hypothetical protein
VLGFAFGISLLTGLICGLVPALQATSTDLVSSLKNEVRGTAGGRFDLRRMLVVAPVAISMLLLIGAGMFVRSLANLKTLDPGSVRESVLMVNVNPQASGYTGQRLREFYERLLARTDELPEASRGEPGQHHAARRIALETATSHSRTTSGSLKRRRISTSTL